jgi:hypothetical protein
MVSADGDEKRLPQVNLRKVEALQTVDDANRDGHATSWAGRMHIFADSVASELDDGGVGAGAGTGR